MSRVEHPIGTGYTVGTPTAKTQEEISAVSYKSWLGEFIYIDLYLGLFGIFQKFPDDFWYQELQDLCLR
jgi:hypothetical protein